MMLLKFLTVIFACFIFLAGHSDNSFESEQKLAAGSQPEISVDKEGIIHIVYGVKNRDERKLYYMFSSDGGKSYSKPALLGNFSHMGLGMGRVRWLRKAAHIFAHHDAKWEFTKGSRPEGVMTLILSRK